MCKTYIVLFVDEITEKVNFDTFTEPTPEEARRSFRECYRHGNYRILSVVEKPEIKK